MANSESKLLDQNNHHDNEFNPESKSFTAIDKIFIGFASVMLISGVYFGLFTKEGRDQPFIPSFLLGSSTALMFYWWKEETSNNKVGGKIGPFDIQLTGATAILIGVSLISNSFMLKQSRKVDIKITSTPKLDPLKDIVVLSNKSEKIQLEIHAEDGITDDKEIIDTNPDHLQSIKNNCLKGEGLCQTNPIKARFSINPSLPKGYVRLCKYNEDLDLRFLGVNGLANKDSLVARAIASKTNKQCLNNSRAELFVEVSKEDIDADKHNDFKISDGGQGLVTIPNITAIVRNPETNTKIATIWSLEE